MITHHATNYATEQVDGCKCLDHDASICTGSRDKQKMGIYYGFHKKPNKRFKFRLMPTKEMFEIITGFP